MSTHHPALPRAPQLKLFTGDEIGEPSREFLTLEQRTAIERDPRLMWTLRQLCDRWFFPGVLQPANSAAGTYDCYDCALRYWEQITGDPSLILVSDEVCIDFVGLFPEWGFSRSGVPLGGRMKIGRRDHFPSFFPLASATIASHVSRIATLLRRAGPRIDPREQTARILKEVPFIPVVEADFDPKAPFSLERARQIAAACSLMDKPELPDWITHELWWRTRLALFYFTGFRAGTVTALAWPHVKEEFGLTWLDVPGEIVKTGKAIKMPLHPQLVSLLACVKSLRPPGAEGDLILPAGCGYRHFLTLHTELQRRAGLPGVERQSPHAWRRTHSEQMGFLGKDRQLEVAREALDHADGRTTDKHYPRAVVNHLRLRLPPLF